ncbi:MAG: hypothetical protein R3B70_17655 [Polyangiaceae bacterium]
MPARALQHVDAEKKDDEALRAEARSHLADTPALQLVAELLARLRAADLPFWSPAVLRSRWNAAERMRWFRQRPDIRQRITTGLTGLAPRAARKKMAEFQAALIDSVIDEGDIPVRAFDESFDPTELAVYGPASAFWHVTRELFPWTDDAPVHQELAAWLLKALLADTSSIPGLGRVPILTPWDLRTAIDGRVWHTRVPLEVRVAIDDARFSQERDRPGAPFHAQDDLAIAVPEIIAASVPLRDLAGVLDAAERAMGFDRDAPRAKAPPDIAPRTKSLPPDAPARGSIPPPAVPPTLAPPPSIPAGGAAPQATSASPDRPARKATFAFGGSLAAGRHPRAGPVPCARQVPIPCKLLCAGSFLRCRAPGPRAPPSPQSPRSRASRSCAASAPPRRPHAGRRARAHQPLGRPFRRRARRQRRGPPVRVPPRRSSRPAPPPPLTR